MPSSSTLLHLVAAWDKYCTSLCVPPKWWSSQQLYKSFQFLIWAYPNPFHLTFFAILPSLHILIVFTLNSFKPRTCLMWVKNTTQWQWTTYKKTLFWMGHSRPLFLYFQLFNTVDLSIYIFADDWIQTSDLWWLKQPLCQLCHNDCTLSQSIYDFIFLSVLPFLSLH